MHVGPLFKHIYRWRGVRHDMQGLHVHAPLVKFGILGMPACPPQSMYSYMTLHMYIVYTCKGIWRCTALYSWNKTSYWLKPIQNDWSASWQWLTALFIFLSWCSSVRWRGVWHDMHGLHAQELKLGMPECPTTKARTAKWLYACMYM